MAIGAMRDDGEVTLAEAAACSESGAWGRRSWQPEQHDIFEVILPKDNEKDIMEVPENLRQGMVFHFVDTLDGVLRLALKEDPFRRRPSLVIDQKESVRPEKNP